MRTTTALPATVKGSFGHAWGQTWRNVVPLLLISIVQGLLLGGVGIAGQMMGLLLRDWPVLMILAWTVSLFLVQVPLSYGPVYAAVRAARGRRPRLGDLFAAYSRNMLGTFVVAVVCSLVVGVGTVLLIVPGVYLAVRLAFAPMLALDQRCGLGEAVDRSWRMTAGRFWPTLGGGLMAVAIVIVGVAVIALGIVPVIALAIGAIKAGQLLLAAGIVLAGLLVLNVVVQLPFVYVQVAFASYYAGVAARERSPAPAPGRIVPCGACGVRIRLPLDLARPAIRCPRCREVVRLGRPAQAPAPRPAYPPAPRLAMR